MSKPIKERIEEWRAKSEPVRARETTSGIPLADLYTEAPSEERIGLPGEFPFTRGVQRTMYRGKFWTMRQYAGFGTAEETNRRYRYLLNEGTTGLSVAFDLPTQMGRDSDDPRAQGEVGKVGVAISSIDDMATLFDGIPLDTVSTSMTINSTAHILLALYIAVAEKQGVSKEKLRGTIQNDILKEYIARGTYIYPPAGALQIVTDIFEYCRNEVPGWNTISISGYHIREAGSTAVQELAFTFGDAIAYVEAAIQKGLAVDSFAPRLAFFFNCHNNFLEEIAKFRAARRIWATIMSERFQAKEAKSKTLRFHTQTAGSSLQAQQPYVNIVRTTVQALAAVMGGTQSLHTNSFDEALGLPTDESATLALRTQQVLAYESGVSDVVDPFGGSYAIEALTDEIESRVWGYLRKIDEMGGMLKAIERGYPQQEIEESAYQYQRSIETKEQIIVGVNSFTVSDEPSVPLLKIDPALEQTQRERLRQFKAGRDPQDVQGLCDAVRSAATEGRNLMPHVLAAVKGKVTLGEISGVLREVFGEYRG